ncbi:tyrosine-type recombinase/integrase [Kaistia terrae]|uniref:Tyrosine-type recombinase/integrase n=1 Tax=Kaistia terrae TaxID=537017 RepID=A0ABW0PVK3_9HYPH|nr:integrase arm-type DNA-binding domain-containing protein [Kaistia terrae]MCX5580217.1 integrase arm-type DNA-binding domain-containing protein [Kaistia terrae]
MALTDAACRNAKASERDFKLSDSGQLYLLVRPNGSKLWRLNYRFNGRQRTLSLGSYPKVSLSQARAVREASKDKLAAGYDPGQVDLPDGMLSISRQFKTVATEWFNGKSVNWVPAHASRVWSRLERDVFPAIGSKDVAAINPGEVLAIIRSVESRDALDVAKRIRQTVSSIFRYAVASSLATLDPAAPLVDALRPKPRVKHMAALREGDLAEFFERLGSYDGNRQTALAIELVAHTFVRTKEIRFARWRELEPDLWRIPAERMKMGKEHIVPLTPHVRTLFAALRDQSDGSDWVFPGEKPGKPISENTMIFGLYRMGYHSRATIHGFRSTASTILNESGLWRPDAIERQLAHVPKNEVRSAYNAALYLKERAEMMEWYSAFLMERAQEQGR